MWVENVNFFASSHGKSACDGVDAVVKYHKRNAELASFFCVLLSRYISVDFYPIYCEISVAFHSIQ